MGAAVDLPGNGGPSVTIVTVAVKLLKSTCSLFTMPAYVDLAEVIGV